MGNNCIVTIKDSETADQTVLTWQMLHAATFTFTVPFTLYLESGEAFIATDIIRLIPGKRMVVFGRFQGKAVAAKLFYDPQHAKRHAERDAAGILTLREYHIPTPELYFQGLSHDKRVQVLIFERIQGADNLYDLWHNQQDKESLMPVLQSVVVELATQHVFGIIQHDVHLQNFLVTDKHIYTLDGGQIEMAACLLPKKQSMDNFTLFLSQFGVGVEKCQEALFRHYCKARGWVIKKDDLVDLFMQIKQWRLSRWEKYERKIYRNSSRFVKLSTWRMQGMVDRYRATPDLMDLLMHPETAFQMPAAKVLKAGRSSTVVKIRIDGREIVVKRYNMKSLWHWLRRCLRPSRAKMSWRLAHKINLFGISTAIPVAFIETRFLGLRGKSYFIADYVHGEDIGNYFARHFTDKIAIAAMVKRIVQMLRGLRKLNMSHGDLKAANILIDGSQKPVFIDLDGTVQHLSLSGLRHAWVNEVKRLLRNFDDMPTIRGQFEAEFKNINT